MRDLVRETHLAPADFILPLFVRHGWLIGGAVLVLFFNLTAFYYHATRWLFLRDAGSKLLHLDRQLGTSDAAIKDIGIPFN